MNADKTKFTVLGGINQVLLLLVLIFFILHFAKAFLVPIAVSGLIAMLLVPVCVKLEKWGIKRALAASITVLLTLLLISTVVYVLINELINLGTGMAVLGDRLNTMLDNGHAFISEHFNVSKVKQKEYLQRQVSEWSDSAGKVVSGAFFSIVYILGNMLIVTVYTILILIYRSRIKNFVLQLVNKYAGTGEVAHTKFIVDEITQISSLYVGGVFLVVFILSIIYFIGLTIIGVENALFFAIVAALINVIPYIGSVAGGIIVVLYTLITRDTLTLPVIVTVFFTVVQQLDSYVLTPNITGGKVRLGPLFTIMVLLLGGMVWGVAGMILFIPILGILKVIFDNVDPLKPYGYLIGDT
ncbi:AI-2E family transporter [Sphingobacterium alkalisoli]|uniref:AI-2E family transporter n=1 Tax=Sphingobacterium alkalisoli TaxID=1874115 RepID=A0A4U0H5Q5_9SPHI|nr:AI-2E family transporter [Sphingobacterium alkalisoli]TJY67040.1 AI-2E family transporter [Sphingobacterium alkalisoli]GGH12614.1 AI-2E family transporter [Sphingobacterium alkalisoli]